MSRLVWNQANERDYDLGLDRGVFYPLDGPGQVWNGLISVEESPSEADVVPRYFDGQKLDQRGKRGEFVANVQAYTYPDDFGRGLFTSRRRSQFGLSYRVRTSETYKIHLVYNALATPSSMSYNRDDLAPFSWTLSTRGEMLDGVAQVSHLVVESSIAYSWTIQALEDLLYGSDEAESRLPSPSEVFQLFEENSILQIIDNGDGTWTAIGPDSVISMLNPTTFQIDWPSAVYISADTYTIHSL